MALYSFGDGKMLEPCGPGGGRGGRKAAGAAAAVAATLVYGGWERPCEAGTSFRELCHSFSLC